MKSYHSRLCNFDQGYHNIILRGGGGVEYSSNVFKLKWNEKSSSLFQMCRQRAGSIIIIIPSSLNPEFSCKTWNRCLLTPSLFWFSQLFKTTASGHWTLYSTCWTEAVRWRTNRTLRRIERWSFTYSNGPGSILQTNVKGKHDRKDFLKKINPIRFQ